MHPEHIAAVRARREFVRSIMGRRPRRRLRSLPRQQQPDTVRLAYFSALRSRILQPARDLVHARLVPHLRDIVASYKRGDARLDAGPGDVNDIVDGIAGDFEDGFRDTELEELAEKYALATSDLQRNQLGRQMQAAAGVEVPINDRRLKGLIKHFTAENVSLIKSIPQRYFAQVEAKVLREVSEGLRWEEIADNLEERYEVSEASAQLVARDQVGKFYGALNEARQVDLGIEGFTWRSVHDNRVRETHVHLDGKPYQWDAPPNEDTGEPEPKDEDGTTEGVIPGEPIQCRCSADPDVTALLDQLEQEDRIDSNSVYTVLSRMQQDAYNPDQPREANGQWGSGGETPEGRSASLSILRDSGGLSAAIEAAEGYSSETLMDPESGKEVSIHEVRATLKALRPPPLPEGEEMITVHHATSQEAAEGFLRDGVIPELKTPSLAALRYEQGQEATFAPGRGLSRGLYVAREGMAESYGRVTLELRVPRSYLEVAPEAGVLGEKDPVASLSTHDGAVIIKPIPPEAIRRLTH